jgi:hypothetical protein
VPRSSLIRVIENSCWCDVVSRSSTKNKSSPRIPLVRWMACPLVIGRGGGALHPAVVCWSSCNDRLVFLGLCKPWHIGPLPRRAFVPVCDFCDELNVLHFIPLYQRSVEFLTAARMCTLWGPAAVPFLLPRLTPRLPPVDNEALYVSRGRRLAVAVPRPSPVSALLRRRNGRLASPRVTN